MKKTLLVFATSIVLFLITSCLIPAEDIEDMDLWTHEATVRYDYTYYYYSDCRAEIKGGYFFIEGAQHPTIKLVAVEVTGESEEATLYGENDNIIWGYFTVITEEN